MTARSLSLLLLCLLLAGSAGAAPVPLRAGWNAVGFDARSLTSLEATGPVTSLASWDGAQYVLAPVQAAQVDGRKGYWVLAQSAATLNYAGAADGPQQLDLTAGWNLVAFPGVGQADLSVPAHVLATFYEIQPDGTYVQTAGRVRSERAYWIYAAGSARLTWNGAAAPSSGLTLVPPQSTVQRLAFTSFTVTSNGQDVTASATWTSSDGSVAAVTEPGLVRGLNVGQAEITASFGGASARATVTVVDTGTVGPSVPAASPSPQPVSASFPNLLMFPGGQATTVARADFNGDGRPDLATATSGGLTVALAKARAGTFTLPSPVAAASCNGTAAGDFNGDGRQDLATNGASAQIEIYYGTATGFDPSAPVTIGAAASGVLASGDLNGDGRPDLAFASGSGMGVLLTGAGGFSPLSLTGTGPFSAAVITDVTGDGRADVIADRTGGLVIWPGDGAGGFGVAQVVSRLSRDFRLADLNGDGLLDVLFTSTGSVISYRLATAAATWPVDVPLAGPGGSLRACFAGDFDGDGRPDIGAVDQTGAIKLYRAAGAPGSFDGGSDFTSLVEPRRCLTADLDGDGCTDLLCSGDNGQQVLFGGPGGFLTSTAFAAGLAPHTLTAGDLTGDGRPDLVAGGTASSLSVLLATGAPGSFGAATATTVTGALVNHLALADLDGDSRLDLTWGTEVTNSILTTVLGLPGGTFAFPGSSLPPSAQMFGSDLADLNGDGRPDLVAATGSGTLNYWLATGPATFGSRQIVSAGSGGRARYPLVGDFNGDGRADLAVTRDLSNQVSVLLAAGAGFATPQSYPVDSQPYGLVARDFNGDGRLDLATSNVGGGSVSVLLGEGAPGTFGAATTYAAGPSPREIRAADLDGDGRLDLVLPAENTSVGRVAVLMAAGAPGAFDTPDFYRSGAGPRAAILVDVDQNGTLDVVTGDTSASTVTVLPGRRR